MIVPFSELDLYFYQMPYLRDIFLTIAFQFEPTSSTFAIGTSTTTTSSSTATSHATSVFTCTTRDLLAFAISSVATYLASSRRSVSQGAA